MDKVYWLYNSRAIFCHTLWLSYLLISPFLNLYETHNFLHIPSGMSSLKCLKNRFLSHLVIAWNATKCLRSTGEEEYFTTTTWTGIFLVFTKVETTIHYFLFIYENIDPSTMKHQYNMIIQQQVYERIPKNSEWHLELFYYMPLHVTSYEQINLSIFFHFTASSSEPPPPSPVTRAIWEASPMKAKWRDCLFFQRQKGPEEGRLYFSSSF